MRTFKSSGRSPSRNLRDSASVFDRGGGRVLLVRALEHGRDRKASFRSAAGRARDLTDDERSEDDKHAREAHATPLLSSF